MSLPTLNTFTANTKIESAKVNENFTNISSYLSAYIQAMLDNGLAASTNTAQSMTSGGWTVVKCEDEDYDTGANYNVATGLYTAPHTGTYLVSFGAHISDLGAGKQMSVGIYVNGALVVESKPGYSAAATDDLGGSITAEVYAVAGQTIGGYVFHNHGSARNTSGSSTQNWIRIRPIAIGAFV